jgi:hypothetical protein
MAGPSDIRAFSLLRRSTILFAGGNYAAGGSFRNALIGHVQKGPDSESW